MTVAASAPGRCGIVGNPSDIYGGFVVSCSTPQRNWCHVEPSADKGLPEDATLWNAAAERFPVSPCRVEFRSEVPRSNGLAGSTALLAAIVACVLRMRGEEVDLQSGEGRVRMAETVRDIELRNAKVVCGYQDAYMAVHGGLQGMDFSGKHPVADGPPGVLTPLDSPLPFLLISTGVERLSGSVHGPMRDRWLSGEREVVEAMERIGELGKLGFEALQKQDWSALAGAMDENHRIVASLGGSGEAIDRLVAVCKQKGARSAKLAGAGLGGTVIALADDCEAMQAELVREGYTLFTRPTISQGLRFESVSNTRMP